MISIIWYKNATKETCYIICCFRRNVPWNEKSNPLIELSLDNSKNEYSEFFILQEIFSTPSEDNDVIKVYSSGFLKTLKTMNSLISYEM